MHEETSPKQLEAGNAETIQTSPSTSAAPEQNATNTIINPDGSTTVVTTSTVTSVVKRVICVTTKKIEDGTLEEVTMETREEMTRIPVVTGPNGQEVATVAPAATADSVSLNSLQTYGPTCSNISSDDTQKDGGGTQDLLKNMVEAIDDNSVFLGLKVYTKGVPVNITGQLRNGVEFSSKLALDS
ncbi:hypothetical protein K435DRAFT_156713 [Dendrothele bispora CBS 962.96]|uniref:Uncharacterized protein n=1 Tax=Dendrothele bispora (strain CBS 962.96) TaxID=1314807 RepID=A0A4S8LXY0_DENBC|nr:hypothetical protein K435DRAFT_156713 [Dendrothele bispora CBS 962.96]